MTTTDAAFDAPPALADPFATHPEIEVEPDLIGRPPRTEDRILRDSRGKPRILPLGVAMPESESARARAHRSFFRPSSYAELLEDHYSLDRWSERKIAAGLMQERRLRLALAALGDTEESQENKEAANKILAQAKAAARAGDKAEEGTALHALTERYDHGLPINFMPEEFEGNLEDWKRLTEHLEILDIECFVVEDEYRCAGTFDRLVRYHEPCQVCGAYLRIADLKSGRIDYGAMKMAAQLAIYAHGRYYVPETGERVGFPDRVCHCSGIIIHVPSGEPYGTGVLRWVNIGQAWNRVVSLSHEVREIRKMSNWWLDFNPVPDVLPLIASATTRAELNGIYAMHKASWEAHHTEAASRRIEELGL